MSRLPFVSIALSLSIVTVSCLSGSKAEHPGAAWLPATGPAWTLTLKSTCLDAAEDQCVGKYGFSVTAEGNYLVGPGPKGQTLMGALSDTEMTDLNSRLNSALAALSPVEGQESGISNNGDESLTLRRDGNETVLAHNIGSEYHFKTSSIDEANSLHKAIRDLAVSYYRLPFGNECSDSAAMTEALYPSVQNCQVDSDCVYVDADRAYQVIAPNSLQYLFTERCEAVTPITVANKISILGGAAAIQEAYNTALAVCGHSQFYRTSCHYEQKSTATAPVCVQNRCQARF